MENSQQSLIIDFKQTFGSEHGQRVLKSLKKICHCNPVQTCFDDRSQRLTDFNLGAQWVTNYIQTQIDSKPVETKDCIVEPEPQIERT